MAFKSMRAIACRWVLTEAVLFGAVFVSPVAAQTPIQVSSTVMNFTGTGGPNGLVLPQSIAIFPPPNSVTITPNQTWLTTVQVAQTLFEVRINPTNLYAGTYTGTLTVSAPGYTSTVVTVNVTLTSPVPNITPILIPAQLTISFQPGDPTPPTQAVKLSLSTSDPFDYALQPVVYNPQDTGWLVPLSPLTGSALGGQSVTLLYNVNAALLSVGSHQATQDITVSLPGGAKGTARLTVTLSVGPDPSTIRINAGGGAFMDPDGKLWIADSGSTNGSVFATSMPIRGTATPFLYQSERWSSGLLSYQFTLPNGNYTVRLKFAEIYFTQPGQRVFDILINGVTMLAGFDPLAAAGATLTAVDRSFPVGVSNGQLNLTLRPVISNPKISAIEIVPQTVDVNVFPVVASVTGGQTQQFTADGPVTWSLNPPTGAGSIDASGLYTAPTVSVAGTATVIATSTIDPSRSARSSIQVTPSWQSQDIGSVNMTGGYSYLLGAHTVSGAGDLRSGADAFRYVYQSITGDGAIIARVNTSGCCLLPEKAGVMIRETLSPDSKMVFQGLYSGIAGLLHARSAPGAGVTTQFGATGVHWVRLVRSGNFFTGYLSNDGVAWSPVGSVAMSIGPTVYVGLGVSSGFGPSSTVIFDNVRVTNNTEVSIDQRLVSLAAGQQAQFTASVYGPGAVTWSISPLVGSISATGLYVAPISLGAPQTVTVTATSTIDPAKSASVVVSLGQFVPVRVNAGGPDHITPTGVFWNGDTGYNNGTFYSSAMPVSNTLTPYLYQTERFHTGSFQYQFYVPNGTYQVTLKFAEIFFNAPGSRVFHVALNGIPQLTNYDIAADAGGAGRAIDKVFIVPVTDGKVTIDFTPVLSNPKINAIEITP